MDNVNVNRSPQAKFMWSTRGPEKKYNVSCEMSTRKNAEGHEKLIAHDPNANGSVTDQKHVPH